MIKNSILVLKHFYLFSDEQVNTEQMQTWCRADTLEKMVNVYLSHKVVGRGNLIREHPSGQLLRGKT